MPTKILVIGPSSIHVTRFINLVKDLFDEVVYVGEAQLETKHNVRQHLINFRSSNPFFIWKNYRKLKRIIETENPIVTHIQQVNRIAYMAARILSAKNRKNVVTAWGSDILLVPKRSRVFKIMTKRVLDGASYITADSNNMISEINKLTSNRNFKLVFFGIEPIKSLPKEKIIYSNRALQELYNIETIIEEFNVFQMLHPDWRLVIAGSGALNDLLREKVKSLNIDSKVDFVGWLNAEKNDEYYKRSSIYVSLPFSDGTSISLLEAMSAGCIPVVSDLPVAYEWIKNKQNGIIKKQGENGFIEALKLDYSEVCKINSGIIEEKATGKMATQKFKEIYDKLKDGSIAEK